MDKIFRSKFEHETIELVLWKLQNILKDQPSVKKDILCSQIGRLNIDKMTLLSKAIYRFNEISEKISMALFCRNRKSCSKIPMEPQGPQIAKTIKL